MGVGVGLGGGEGEVVSEETGSVPSQAGAQELPLARMKAMSNAFWPVADMTDPRSGAAESSTL